MEKTIYIAGHTGMVGSALARLLAKEKNVKLITARRQDLDLTCQTSVLNFFSNRKIDEVYLAAAKVGGIHANSTFPAEFIYRNLIIQSNVIHAAHLSGVQRLLFLGSSCIYPVRAPQPMNEECLLTGQLEPTNEPYAIAKIAGIKMCESYNRQYGRDYRCVMPTNLYGPFDNFHPENSHVIPAMLNRFHQAVKSGESRVVIWGSGKPKREFLHVDDMAAACVHVMALSAQAYREATWPACGHLNVGSGQECTIRELAEAVARVTGFKGDLVFDDSRPDGAPRKLLDVARLTALGWKASVGLEGGLHNAYQWFLDNIHRTKC